MDFGAEKERLQKAVADPPPRPPLPPVRPFDPEDPLRVRLSRHEAGHAVVGVLLGRGLLDVRLTETGGLCSFDPSQSYGDPFRPAIEFAGPLADFTLPRKALDNYHFVDAERAARHWIEDEPRRWHGWTPEDLLRAERICAQKLLDRYESAVDALGRYLQAHGQIDGSEAEELLQRHGVEPLPQPVNGRPSGW